LPTFLRNNPKGTNLQRRKFLKPKTPKLMKPFKLGNKNKKNNKKPKFGVFPKERRPKKGFWEE